MKQEHKEDVVSFVLRSSKEAISKSVYQTMSPKNQPSNSVLLCTPNDPPSLPDTWDDRCPE